MYYKIYILVSFFLLTTQSYAQQQTVKPIRIVDTLTTVEKSNRNPIILQTELDSLIKAYNVVQLQQQPVDIPIKEENTSFNQYILVGFFAIISLLLIVIYLSSRHQKKIGYIITGLKEKLNQQQSISSNTDNQAETKPKNAKQKISYQSLESRIASLTEELQKLSKEREGLGQLIKEYNGVEQEYNSLKQGVLKAYKVKNYPGNDKSKHETIAIQSVLDTESALASYAYERFLKPILLIADAHKNSPAKITDMDSEKLLDLLVSLSFFYIEYLYLRINDLSIGGKMVDRINGFANGNGIDMALLKQLNTESGNRALVIRMALNKALIHQLSYPVFDETNLNNQ